MGPVTGGYVVIKEGVIHRAFSVTTCAQCLPRSQGELCQGSKGKTKTVMERKYRTNSTLRRLQWTLKTSVRIYGVKRWDEPRRAKLFTDYRNWRKYGPSRSFALNSPVMLPSTAESHCVDPSANSSPAPSKVNDHGHGQVLAGPASRGIQVSTASADSSRAVCS